MKTLFICDRPEHGYNCFHLEEDLSGLSRTDREEWKFLKPYCDHVETVEQANAEIKVYEHDVQRAQDNLDEAEQTLEDMQHWRELLLKRDRLDKRGMIQA